MTIANRLKKLEQAQPEPSADSQARQKLIASLQTIYERIGPQDITEVWLAGQSNATTMAIALFGPLPLPPFLKQRLTEIANTTDASGTAQTV